MEHFDSVVTRYWQTLRPLYRKLHAYVRYKLRALYPGRFGARDPIPVHLLGACPAQLPLWPSFWTRTHTACEHCNTMMWCLSLQAAFGDSSGTRSSNA